VDARLKPGEGPAPLPTIFRRALVAALRSFWRVIVIVLPITVVVVALQYSPVLPWIVEHLAPSMKHLGLPGGAALALVLGLVVNIYAALTAAACLGMSAGEMTTLALVLGFAHNLLVEGTLLVRLTPRGPLWILVRLVVAALAGWALGPWFASLWPDVPAHAAAVAAAPPPATWLELLQIVGMRAGKSALQLFLILLPIVFLLEVFEGLGWLARLRAPLRPFTRLLGLEERSSEAFLAGLFFGLVYGAGVILQRVQADGMTREQIDRMALLLGLMHAIVEDTLLFVPFGAHAWPVVVVRVTVAVAVALVLPRAARARPATEEVARVSASP
jgi:hypothetical protein